MILAEPDLGDAEQETLEALAHVRAAAAGAITSAEDIIAARHALQRVFSGFVLHDLRDLDKGLRTVRLPKRALTDTRGWVMEPVPRPQMIVTDTLLVDGQPYPVERLRKVPLSLQASGGGSKGPR